MLLKTLIAVCVIQVAVDAASTNTWTKIASDVCVGARSNHFKEIIYPRHGGEFVGAIKLVHKRGQLGCYRGANSNWGCAANRPEISMTVTDAHNQVIYPSGRFVNIRKGGWYNLPGYTSSSPALVLVDFSYTKYMKHGDKLRIWYGEDLNNYTEHDNHGFSCMDVYVYVI